MTTSSPNAQTWLKRLSLAVDAMDLDAGPLPDAHMLSARKDWQRRISGGAMLSFLEFATGPAHDLYPKLGQNPITERVFVFVTDRSGQVAARDLMDQSSGQAICVNQNAWRMWLDDPSRDHDDAFEWHYECWSTWHRNVDDGWDIDRADTSQLWVHEEGFALDDGLGRGAQHVWDWTGAQMRLVAQDVTQWVEDEAFGADAPHHHEH